MRSLVKGDAGETLVELLVSLSVLGMSFAAVLGAVATAVDSSRTHRDTARAQSILRSWAETLSHPQDTSATSGYVYTPCAGAAAFPAASASVAVPAGWTASIASIKWWNGTAWSTTSCDDAGLQKLTLTLTTPAGIWPGTAQSLDVVLRRPCADASC